LTVWYNLLSIIVIRCAVTRKFILQNCKIAKKSILPCFDCLEKKQQESNPKLITLV